MFDIDHFKKINDKHGHLTGDYVLRELARRVRTRVRREELLARYGGEEFALTLPETSREQAMKVGEDLRRLVAAEPFEFEGDRIPVTISVGVGTTVERGRRRRVHQDRRRQPVQSEARRPQPRRRLTLHGIGVGRADDAPLVVPARAARLGDARRRRAGRDRSLHCCTSCGVPVGAGDVAG